MRRGLSPMRCRKCGGTKWMQKELRKTGMTIVDGEIVFSDKPDEESKIQVICYNCCVSMEEEDLRRVAFDSVFPEPLGVEAN